MSSTVDPPPPLVVVPVYGNIDLVARALTSIDEHTAVDVPLLVIDDAGPERLTEAALDELLVSGRPVRFVAHPKNRGFVSSANEGFGAREGRDVVIVNSDVVVFAGWLDGLKAAATAGRVATVTATTNAGSIATDEEASRCSGPGELATLAGAAQGEGRPPRLIPVAVGHCVYITDAALRDVGDFDEAFAPGYGEEVDWSIRAVRRGWNHVLSPAVVVWHEAGGSFGSRSWLRRRHELRLAWRYPREFVILRRRPGQPLRG